MRKLFANPIITAITCFAATFVGQGIHVLIYHNTFNLYTCLGEAVLFGGVGAFLSFREKSRKTNEN